MSARHQEALDGVLVLHLGGGLAAPAAPLRGVLGQRLSLDITFAGERHHAVFHSDEVLDIEVFMRGDNFGTARIAVLFTHGQKLVANLAHQAFGVGENVQQIVDLGQKGAIFIENLVLFQTGQAMQAQFENGLSLFGGQPVEPVLAQTKFRPQPIRARGGGPGAFEHLPHEPGGPATGQQPLARLGWRRGRLDDRDDLVDVRQRDSQPFENMTTFARLAQIEHGTTGDHLATVTDERFQHRAQAKQARLSIDQRHHIDAEHALHRGVLIEVIEHYIAHLAPAQLDDDAHAVLVGLVAQLGDALDLLFLDQLGNTLDEARLVYLVRQLGDDDAGLAAAFVVLEVRTGTDKHTPTPGTVGFTDACGAVDDARRGKIRPRNPLEQGFLTQLGIVDQSHAGIEHFGDIVRRNIGGHTHRDTGRTVDQKVGNARGENRRLTLGTVIVGRKIDGFLVDVGLQLVGDARHAHLGVTHRRRRIAVHRTEVTLPVHQHVAHGERLCHAHDGVIDRHITVRVVLTDDVTHHAGGFLVGLVPVVAQLAHREQDTPVNRLQTITHIRQRAADDHAHGVIHVRMAHLIFEVDRKHLASKFSHEPS